MSGVKVSERTVRRYVRKRKAQLGLSAREVFIPQQYEWGVEAQVDWYEAVAEVSGERQTVQLFCMRSMASGAAFHRAYPRAMQQAFLEAHELAFAYFGGVFRRLRYDNLTSAVKKILRGSRREETWQQLQRRHGATDAMRLMIELLQEGKRTGYEQLTQAITQALKLGTGEALAKLR